MIKLLACSDSRIQSGIFVKNTTIFIYLMDLFVTWPLGDPKSVT